MNPRLKTALALVGSFALGGGLLWLALRGVDLSSVGTALADARWGWALPLVLVTVASHALRAWRWQLLLGAMPGEHERVGFGNAFASLLIGYLVNQAAPRLGEVARAANLSSRSDHTFSGVFGTVVAERVLDVVSLAIALLSVVLLFGSRVGVITERFVAGTMAALEALPISGTVLVLLLAASGAALLALAWFAFARGGEKVRGVLMGFKDGLASLLRVRQRLALVGSTLGIWVLYGVMTYIPLALLGLTDAYGLGFADAWALMNLGAVGMSLPSPGGTGSYHYIAVQTLVLLLGVAQAPAAAYAILTHASQLVLMCVLGVIALVWQGTSFRAVTRSARDASA
ncbi:lysylphosphatidylglycerol synthase transmembrane domain-containing protein [Rubricoccus marinus]|uniref:TIGR00374 family protein n=1 Tax=Rubricoccus marinus TaxID=716817 RepID=A0A259U0V1_9BACT|nr:lysylphosphatidylglycerol synthase transmembrane domain-containing protein [Rubricoccus marinus]OZC03570.1 hypothetical protein BSZ36_11615 [Rubricoccus marinus]